MIVDVLGYYGMENFIGYTDVANMLSNDPMHFWTIAPMFNTISHSMAPNGKHLWICRQLVLIEKNFMLKANYFSDYLQNKNNSQINNFNTPKYHVNLEFSNSGFGKKQRLSFGTSVRYKPSYYYVVSGGLARGTVPSSLVLDAQVSYKFPSIHSSIKLGSTNLTNKYYSTGTANPAIGGVYYVTYAYNVF